MTNIDKLLLTDEATIHDAIERLDNNEAHIILVVDGNHRLLGTVTDGDVRRGILKGIGLNEPIIKIMNHQPIVGHKGEEKNKIYNLMRRKLIRQIPIVDTQGKICDLEVLEEVIELNRKHNIVVLMAGGLSTRLRPLTNDCPKPMLKIGEKPILETILYSLIQYGFNQFYISINYLGDQIREYFGNGAQWGVDIQYLQENNKMGTAGSLSLLPKNIQQPLLVMNSDLLTKVDFNQLLAFHYEHGASATMCVREFDYTVPYGTCKLENNFIIEVIEKPTYKFFINAGVYVLEPKLLNIIPQNSYFDMPALFSLLTKLDHQAAAFPIREYWLDIGQLSDFERAHAEYERVFEV